ncbi:MAG: ABC transporter ATP-binding protein [Acidobacteriota bacterium]|nr:ABC transporter ATP-binding protein [Acidobacteriota bacterium]
MRLCQTGCYVYNIKMNLLTVENLEAGYDSRPVVSNLNLTLEGGEFLSVCGPNGSGKSTLVKAIQGLVPFIKGKILIDGQNLFQMKAAQIATKLAYVPQVFEPVFDFTVEETVAMARYHRQANRFSHLSDLDKQAVEEAMGIVLVYKLKHKKLNELSGGERQRVLIARALAQDTPILLLDEPSSHLDLNFQLQIYQLLKRLQEEKGKAILVAEHNLNLVIPYSSRLIFLKDGRVEAEGKPASLLTEELIKRIFQVDVELRENRSTRLPEISLIHTDTKKELQEKESLSKR